MVCHNAKYNWQNFPNHHNDAKRKKNHNTYTNFMTLVSDPIKIIKSSVHIRSRKRVLKKVFQIGSDSLQNVLFVVETFFCHSQEFILRLSAKNSNHLVKYLESKRKTI